MPSKLNSTQLREWYERFSKELYEKASIDVTRREDLGRVKNFDIKNWTKEDIHYAEVDFSYAYMPRNEGGYVNPMPDMADFPAYSKWMLDNLTPAVTDDQIQALYDQSRSGTLMIFQPGKTIHNMRQVYTDEQGNLHTSLPMDQYENMDMESIPEDLRLPEVPEYMSELTPDMYYRHYPQAPEAPNIGNPGFFSWVGYLLGINTDYAKKVHYEEALVEYKKQADIFMESLSDPKQQMRHEEYQRFLNEYIQASERYPVLLDNFYNSHLGKLTAIDKNFRERMRVSDDGPQLAQFLENETKFLAKQHAATPLGMVSNSLTKATTYLNYPNRTKQVVRNLVGDGPDPNLLKEWIDLGVIPKGVYKPAPYVLPKRPEYETMTADQKRDYDKQMSSLAEIAGFAAITDPQVAISQTKPGLTPEENAQIRFGMILNDLFTRGRPAGKQHIDVLEPARQKAKEALEAFIADDPKPLAELLARGLKYTNREARLLSTLSSDHAVDTLYLVGRLHDALTSNPKLLEAAALDPAELKEAEGNMAMYQVACQGQRAKQAIMEHSLYKRDLSQEDLLQAAKDLMFANIVSRDLSPSHDSGTKAAANTPEMQLVNYKVELGQKYLKLTPSLHQANLSGDTVTAKNLQADIDYLKKMAAESTNRYTLMDYLRPAHAVIQDLQKPEWVAAIKEQIAGSMDLSKMVSGSREELGKLFSQDSKLMETLDETITTFKQDAQKQKAPELGNQEPEKEAAHPQINAPSGKHL